MFAILKNKGLDPDKPRYLTKVTQTFNILENFDIVLVGAGSAGCIVANQIINNTNYKVLLIEAGPSDNKPNYPSTSWLWNDFLS